MEARRELEEGGLNVHLINIEIVFGSEGEESMNGGEFGDRCESVGVIDSVDPSKSLCYKLCLVLLNFTIRCYRSTLIFPDFFLFFLIF
jgi:hypothetical protein